MGGVYTLIDWVTFNTDTKEVIGCVEREDGGMTPVRTVGTWEERLETGLFLARIKLDDHDTGVSTVQIHVRTSGKNLEDLRDSILKILKEDYEDQVRCSPCEGTGLFATATWYEPEVPCDYCQGTGENNPEEENDE